MTGYVLYLVLSMVALATLVIVGLIAWSLGVLRQPRVLVERGQWREASVAAERLGASWLRLFPSVREEASYAQAACLHLEGKFDDSLATIAALRKRSPKGRFATAVALLEGANLVMSGGDARLAVDRLSAACAPRAAARGAEPLPEDLLFLALARLAAGDATSAEETFERAGVTRPKSAPSPGIYEPAFRYLRGLYLLKTSRADDAAKDLEAAASSAIVTVYVERARALAPPRSSSDDLEARTSLTPQVIDE